MYESEFKEMMGYVRQHSAKTLNLYNCRVHKRFWD